jgi:metal-dependent amidase/aminoacylase/carboxypeptidase family protein
MMGRRGNVVSAQAFVLERLHTIVEGLEQEGAACHTTVGQVTTDGFFNIVPRSARLRGTVRTFTPELRAEALDRLQGLLTETDTEFSVRSELEVVYETVPLFNDPDVTRSVLAVGERLLGPRSSVLGRPLTVSDDMAEFLTHIPGCYFMVGAKPADLEEAPAHHSPTFRIEESALGVGVRMLLDSAIELAAEPS